MADHSVAGGIGAQSADAGVAQVIGPRWYLAIVLAVAAGVPAVTRSPFAGDGYEYARHIAASDGPSDPTLLEPGHLLWRPFGALLAPRTVGTSHTTATRVTQRRLNHASRAATVVAIAAFGALAAQLAGTTLAALTATALFGLGSAFIIYGGAATAYQAGLAWLTMGLALGWRRKPRYVAPSLGAGAALGLGALTWLPYALVIPGALLGTVLLNGARRGLGRAILVGAVAAVVVFGALVWGARRNGVHGFSPTVAWIRSSSHGIERPGMARAAVGMVRLIADVGEGPRVVKRYQARDPHNPVVSARLASLWLWPAALLLAVGAVGTLWRAGQTATGRAVLFASSVALLPVLFLALAWSGSEQERFLPVYPFLMAAVAVAALPRSGPTGHGVAATVVVPFGIVAMANLWSLSTLSDRARVRAQVARLGCIANSLSPSDRILIPEAGDPLRLFSESHLDAPPRRNGALVLTFLPRRPWHGVDYRWDSAFIATADSTLATGGRVYVPAYIRAEKPPSEADWIEGEANSVPWSDVVEASDALTTSVPCVPSHMLEVTGTVPAGTPRVPR